MEPLIRSGRNPRCAGLVIVVALAGPLGAAGARAEDPHAHCHGSPSNPAWDRTTGSYKVPDVKLLRADGTQVRLLDEIDDGKPVILNFIFTSCTTICPLMSQTFTQVQSRLQNDVGGLHMISVSIDPEQDTPAELLRYADKFHAGAQWTFYTGTEEASISLQKAFGAYRGNKMNHVPATFLRAAPGKPWVRLEGFASPDDVVKEYRALLAAR